MNKIVFCISTLALLGLATVPASAQSICDGVTGNLISNCGFETGDFSDWSVGGAGPQYVGASNAAYPTITANSGNDAAWLGGVGGDGTVTQTFYYAPTSGTQFNASFFLNSDGGTPSDFTVFWNGVDAGPDLSNTGSSGWVEYSATLTGDVSGTNTLEFVARNDPSYWGLDDVVFTSTTPEPASMFLMGSALLGLIGVARRRKA